MPMSSLSFCSVLFCFSLHFIWGVALNGACNQIQPGLYTFGNFSTNEISASGPLPFPGQCKSWSLTINYINSSTPQCTSPSSTLMFEFWITDSNLVPVDPQLTVPGIYLMASRNSAVSASPPMVFVSSDGLVTYSPVQTPGYTSTDQLLQYTYVDSMSVYNSLTTQRFLIPVGSLFDSFSINTQTWFLSLQNSNTQPLNYPGLPLYYAIRATCMPVVKLPCARPSPSLWGCNQPWSASNDTTLLVGTSSCMQFHSASKYCACNASQAGASCNIPVTSINNLQSLSVAVPGSSWRYFHLEIASTSIAGSLLDARLLAQFIKPAAVYSQLQPILLLSARSNGSSDQLVYDVPGVSSISSLGYNLFGDCTCQSCPCYIPYQAELLNYAGGHFMENITNSWWLALYNSAPYQGPPTSSSPTVQLSVQWTTSTVVNGASPLCPSNCSGQGVCVNPAQVAPMYQQPLFQCNCKPVSSLCSSVIVNLVSQQPLFQCNCKPGYGGPYCQGVLQANQISTAFPSSMATIPAGQWMYYTFAFQPNSMPNWDGSATFTWSLGMNSNVLVVMSSLYANSEGQLYFMPQASLVFNETDPNYFKFYNLNPQQLNWVVGFLNSAANSSYPASISVGVSVSTSSGTNLDFVNTLQIALIASVAGLILVLILFMTVRLLMLRRVLIANTRRAAMEVEVAGVLGGGGVAATQSAPQNHGVPSDVSATFLTFKFEAATYVSTRSQRVVFTSPEMLQEVPAEKSKEVEGSCQQQVPAMEAAGAVADGTKVPAAVHPVADGSGSSHTPIISGVGSGVCGENMTQGGRLVACESRSDIQTEEHNGRASASDSDSDMEQNQPQCSICICDFEEGEELLRLPCNHDYHKACIDAWMVQHSTCPNCRRALWTGAVDGTPARPRRRRGTRNRRSRSTAPAPGGVLTRQQLLLPPANALPAALLELQESRLNAAPEVSSHRVGSIQLSQGQARAAAMERRGTCWAC
ncbi:hypothetical protein CEUSTIGMA_g3559.t1 [Chlamydomonas eustigma]|uniref:RING-type E3 ubiquitin transferase n=1 Tax=Chlamydomonas eustigma TaxID=1157962 RepID=A0A250WZA8_9CHLO|nr:hypothetical protein CEUSTIGMA_g3559.t1 [Chlamydomonas eustigma]|eukprot:GAX76116.1 hypothetical protein CEUSTIGMA_g3559.t1 [Chlamydomonas eustigma]